MTETMQSILRDMQADRVIGTEDHWWESQVGEFYLDDDFGEYDPQKAADKRRMIRVPAVERELAEALAREKALREALEFYANPEVYRPHSHGVAFDRRDISYVALAALSVTT